MSKYRSIIAIVDTKANDIVGQTVMVAHEAVAMRYFNDAMSDPSSPLRKYAEDFELRELARIDTDTLELLPSNYTLITGQQWLAAQPQQES